MQNTEPRKTYSVTEAAQLLQVNRQVIYRMLRAGNLPGSYRANPFGVSDFRIPQEDIDAVWAKRNEAKAKNSRHY